MQTVERYDVDADKWSPVAAMNVQRGGVGVAALEKYLYAVGGNDGTSSLDSCERYDPILNKWILVASMQHRRSVRLTLSALFWARKTARGSLFH